MLVEEHVSLQPFNTFQLDAKASFKVTIAQPEDLEELYQNRRYKTHKKLVLGGGSNVLFTRNFLGMVLKMEISGIRVEEDSPTSVLASFGAGENWHQCVLWAVENELGGIENLSFIPGTIGAAPMQNIGAYGVELKEVFHSLEAYEISSGKIVRFYKEDCKFDYRYSVFKGPLKDKYIITRVFLRLSKQPVFNVSYGTIKDTLEDMGVRELNLKNVSQAVINIRQNKLPDPAQIGNAGSFFKNPVVENEYFDALRAAFSDIPGYRQDDDHTKIPAGWMIEKCEWKGKRQGNVGVHDKQALVLVNYGAGKGREVLNLSRDIQKSVFKTFGIQLDAEVNII